MDPAINKGRENVDSNDSNFNGTLCKTKNIKDLKCGEKENHHPSKLSTHSFTSTSSSSSSSVGGDGIPIPPDGGWGWIVVFAAFMINLIADGISLSIGILFIDLDHHFGASKAKTSWVGSILLSMPLLGGPVASYLIDRYGCRKMCILGALLSTFSFVFSIYAESLEWLFMTFTIAGLGLALCYVTSIVIVAYYFEKKRSLATGLAACGTGIGTFVFPPLTIYFLEQYGWPGTLMILSGFFLNLAVFGALMRDLDVPSVEESVKPESSGSLLSIHEERLCSSMLQLPTYLGDNCPEVISELSRKEGTYLNSLLEQHPYILGNIIGSKNPEESADSSTIVNQDDKRKEKKKKRLHSDSFRKYLAHSGQKALSGSGKLDAAYLRNLKVQRGSITYRGAMLNIHRYRLKASSCPDIFRNSMVTISEEKSCLFLHDLKDLMLEMFNFSNFKNIGYTIFCISNFLLYACVDIPYVYIPDHALTIGIDMERASLLISVLGVLNCLGVVIVGYIGDKPWIDPSLLYSGFIFISGLSFALVPVITNYYATATLVGIFGFMISANYTLVPIIIVNLISLDNFTGAYGVLLLIQGIASLVGPPIAGAFFDMSGNYDITFYSTGLIIIVSGALVIPVAKSWVCRRVTPANSNPELVIPEESRKVKFQEPVKSSSVQFLDSKQEMKVLNDPHACENTIPLLSNNDHLSSCKNVNAKNMSIYSNPLAVV